VIDLDLVLGSAKLPERTVPVCLDGDLLAALQEAQEAYAEAFSVAVDDAMLQQRVSASTEDMTAVIHAKVADLQAAANAAQAAVRAAQHPFRLRAVPQHMLTSLALAHPPREGVKSDQDSGVDTDGFELDLLRASLVDPMPTDEQWTGLLASLHPGEQRKLTTAADALSRRQANLVPFSFGASAPTPASGGKSKPRAASA